MEFTLCHTSGAQNIVVAPTYVENLYARLQESML
jgi:hypothetical protein